MTDGRVLAGGRFAGCGFAITDRAVVTACHVVRGHPADNLRFALPGVHEPLPVSRVDADEEHDVAVLHLGAAVDSPLTVSRAVPGSGWRVDAQPLDNDPGLTGTVTDAARSVVNAGGSRIDLVQLRVDHTFEDFDGYSGSAVMSAGPGGGVIGVLVEQVPYRRGHTEPRASNVLYAVPIQHVITRFGLEPAAGAGPAANLAGIGAVYAEWIENFLGEYLGDHRRRVPFGGRSAQLGRLDAWLASRDAPPYALITAEAGRGKSALLCRWAAHVAATGTARVVFVPISIRFQTAQAGVALPALAARLAGQHGEAVSTAERSAEQWQAEITAYLRRQPRGGKPLLVIIDGLDEATDWEPGAHLFPANPPAGVRVVVSARFVAGDTDETGWRTRLNWSGPALAESIALPPLDRAGVGDVLLAMGNPLAHLVSRVDIVEELYRLSEGDPLLLHLYIDELSSAGGDTTSLTPEELPSIEKGMRGYFERWSSELERVWRAGARPATRPGDLWDFLHVLASALGPLTIDDVEEVNPRAPAGFELTWLLKEVERFVIGDGVRQGFVFSHPRFGMFFHEKMGRRERDRWRASFLDYGRRTVAGLLDGSVEPAAVSGYVLNYHGAHLENAGAPGADLFALLDGRWLAAWHAVDGTDAGFLNDCDRAWRRAEQDAGSDDPAAAERATETVFVCALARGSVAARSSTVPPRLLSGAVTAGLLTAPQALAICRRIPDEWRRATAVVTLAPALGAEWAGECLSVASTMRDSAARAHAITSLAPLLDGPALARAHAVARSLPSPPSRARALAAVSACLPGPARGSAAEEALSALLTSTSERERGAGLVAVARFLPPELLPGAVRAARDLPDPIDAVPALCALAEQVTGPEKDEIIGYARQLAADPGAAGSPRILLPLAHHATDLRARALDSVRQMPNRQESASLLLKTAWWREHDEAAAEELLVGSMRAVVRREGLLQTWAASLSRAARERALAVTADLPKRAAQVLAAAQLLAIDGPGAPAGKVRDLVEAARTLENGDRALVLTLLATCHTGRARRDLLDEALRSAQTISDAGDRLSALSGSFASLTGDDLAAAQLHYLALCRELPHDQVATMNLLKGLGTRLATEAVDDALALCRSIVPVPARVEALHLIARKAPADRRTECLSEALAQALTMGNPLQRLAVLIGLRDAFDDELDRHLITAAEGTGSLRQSRLLTILPHLRGDDAKREAVDSYLGHLEEPPSPEDLEALIRSLPRGVPETVISDLVLLLEREATTPGPWLSLIPRLSSDQVEHAVEMVHALPAQHRERSEQPGSHLSAGPAGQWVRDRTEWVLTDLGRAVTEAFGRLTEDARRRLLPVALRSWHADAVGVRRVARMAPEDLLPAVIDAALRLPADARVAAYQGLRVHHPAEALSPLRAAVLAAPLESLPFESLSTVQALTPDGEQEALFTRILTWTRGDRGGLPYYLTRLLRLYRYGPPIWRSRIAGEIVGELGKGIGHEAIIALDLVILGLDPHELQPLEGLVFAITDRAAQIEQLCALINRSLPAARPRLWRHALDLLPDMPDLDRDHLLLHMLGRIQVDIDAPALTGIRSLVERAATASTVPLLTALARLTEHGQRAVLIAEALDAARTFGDTRDRDEAVAAVARAAGRVPACYPALLRACADITSGKHRRKALLAITGTFTTWPDGKTGDGKTADSRAADGKTADGSASHRAWCEAIRILSAHPRPIQAADLVTLASTGSPAGLPPHATSRAVVSALMKVGEWWD
ncbi:hypothetical protein [Actinoplanes sp. GCM10030250]|uniref:serine protease n=1 Tax=Actinoplanes sp. GCM10030250 TaxID=3273376 RepID=UPI00360744B1